MMSMKNNRILNLFKRSLILVSMAIIVSSCYDKEYLSLKERYGTIDLFLDHFSNYSFNWVNSNLYPDLYKKEKCYDVDGVIYNILYEAKYVEINKEKADIHRKEDEYISYACPHDDYACIYVKKDGTGYIDVAPDLSRGLMIYIQIEKETTDQLFIKANEMLASYIEK